MRIAVAPDKFSVGVGSTSSKRPRATYDQLDLLDALERVYTTDAHAVGYVLPADHELVVHGRQPRLTKSTDPAILAVARFTTIFVDVDNPGHAPWTDELRAEAIARYRDHDLPFGVYHTTGGARFVLPLVEPVPVLEAEPLIRRAFSMIDAAGFVVDWSGKDWTRHMRMPHVVRGGRQFISPFVDFERMRPVELEPLDIPTRETQRRSKRASLPPIPFTPTLAEHWQARARAIGETIARTVTTGYHDMYLAIAGALLQRQVPPEHVPELVRIAAMTAGSAKPPHHERNARDTVARYLSGQPVTGLRNLVVDHPAVADAIHDALADARDIHLRSQTSEPAPPSSSLADTVAALERTIANAPDGLSVVVAECGLGKTRAAQNVAAARAASKPATSKRAPLQTKTAISVDKTELAEQIADDLAAAGVPVRRVFGPLSVLDDRGEPVCKFAAKALPLVEGGQSIRWEFCLGRGKYFCEYYRDCTAKDGFVDSAPTPAVDSNPRVTVGTHALLRELDAAAGATGLLVIDEPPALLETHVILVDDLQLALNNVSSFQRDFAEAMHPVLLALRDWDDPAISFDDLTDTLERPPIEDAEGNRITRPPLRSDTARACRADIVLARIVGKVSYVLRALFRAMTNADATVRLELEPTRIVVTCPREDLTLALRREGSVVAMDANADLHLPAFTKVVGYEPPVHRFYAEDGAPIERTILRCGSATRSSWLSHGRVVLDTGLLTALRGIVAWARNCAEKLERPVHLAIITMRVIELAIRAGTGEDVIAEWTRAKQSARVYHEASSAIGAILRVDAIAGVATAHYGATRGLNRLASVDCLATLGDPWSNGGIVEAEAAYLAVDRDERWTAIAQAELEQAHGRLRTVHRRTRGFALHVGHVVPGGSGWKSSPDRPAVRATRLVGGRPPAGAPFPPGELERLVQRLGGVRAVARAVGCSHTTIGRYLAGARVPPGVASALRQLAAIGVSVPAELQEVERKPLLNTLLLKGVSVPPPSGYPAPAGNDSTPRTTGNVATSDDGDSFSGWLDRQP